jgi:hypothetical protein
MKTKITLIADEGKILTDGKMFGRIVYLGAGADPADYYEIDEAAYEEKMKGLGLLDDAGEVER